MSVPRYPKYKDSGVEWLGEVPAEWSVKPLKCVATLKGGGTPSKENLSYWEGDVPWASSKDLKSEWISDTQDHISSTAIQDGVAELVPKSSVLVVVRGMILLHSFPVTRLTRPMAINQDLKALIPQSPLSTDYLAWLLRGSTEETFARIDEAAHGTKVLRIDWWTSMLMPIPPVPEQALIAAFLDRETAKIDDLVAEQRRLIELLKEKRQAVISHAVTKGLNPHASMKPSGIEWLGDVPETWTLNKLGRAVFMQEGPGLRTWQFTDDGTRVICVTNITETGIDFSRLEKFISKDEYNSDYRHFTVRPGDVLLSSSGNSWGKVAIYEGEEEVILNTSTIRLNENDCASLNRDFIAILLQSDPVRKQLELAMTGSCQPNFGPTHLNSLLVAIPGRAEQYAIVEYVKTEIAKLDALTAEAERAIDLLQERRTALISAAVTGKIDVRGLVKSEAA